MKALKGLSTIFLMFLLTCCHTFGLSEDTKEDKEYVVNTGHKGKIFAVRTDASRNIIVSGGEDGTIQVWDGLTLKPKTILRLSNLSIRKIALHPELPQVAVIESDNISIFTLSVWDYERKKKLFSIALNELPLFLEYSPAGSFILYSRADWKSLQFVNSQDGRLLPYLSQGFGIVTSAFLSQSEKTIVTYSPSGSIQYWDIQGESRKADFVTNQDLDAITYMQNGVSMVAANKESILHIELVGKRNKDRLRVISSIPLRNVLYTAIVSQNEVAVVSFSETTTIYLWNLQSTYLRKVETNKPLPAKPTSLGYMSGRLFLSFENGTIAAVDTASGQLEFFANHTLIDIDDATINGGTIMLSSNETLIGLRSDYLSRLNEKVTSFTAMQIERPFSGKLGIIPLGTEDFLIYPHEGDSGRIALFSPSKGLYGFYDGYPAPFIKAEARGDKLLTLDINGTVSVIDLKNGTTTFSYTAYGIKTVTFVRDGKIMAGRNRTENMQTSLLLIDPKTGETVAVADENVVSFSLVYDETSDRLYSLGFETRNGRQKTVLKEHSGETYERIETLIAYSGEDVGATLAFDTTRSRLYTSIGYGTVNTFGYGGFTSLEEQNHIPQSLKATNGLLLSLNKDSSLTVWETQTGRIAMEIYFFKDGGILCMLKGGRIATGGAEQYVISY